MVELGSHEFWAQMATDPSRLSEQIMTIDLIDLQKTLQKQPGLRAWIGAQYEAARVDEEQADFELKKAKAAAVLRAKAEKDPDTKKDKTVQVLGAEVEVDSQVTAAADTYFAAMRKKGLLKNLVDSLDHRKDMLIQISSNQRKEQGDYNR